MSTTISSPIDFYKKAVSVARHYGFTPIQDSCTSCKDQQRHTDHKRLVADPALKKIDYLGGELALAMKWCVEHSLVPNNDPHLLYYIGQGGGSSKTVSFGLQIIGTKQSIAEALILKTAMTIIDEMGVKNAQVYINSVGDKDSAAKFIRESTAYLRKNIETLPPQAHQLLKDDVYQALLYLSKKKHPLFASIPRPMEFLTSPSRRHLREVLEYIETANIPYELDEYMLGHKDCYTQTIFEIRQNGAEANEATEYVAKGGRYDELPRRFFKVQAPAVGLIFSFNVAQPASKAVEKPLPSRGTKPRVCFIHVGFEAKLKSLHVIETFRKARVPFAQCLNRERLTEQLSYAENVAAPYTVIMGHKEAMENTVIVRNTSTRAQQTVSIELLPSFFKNLA